MTPADFWEATPWQVVEFVNAVADTRIAAARQSIFDAANTAAFAAAAFTGGLSRAVRRALATFDARTTGEQPVRRAQTPEEMVALLRSFAKPKPVST